MNMTTTIAHQWRNVVAEFNTLAPRYAVRPQGQYATWLENRHIDTTAHNGADPEGDPRPIRDPDPLRKRHFQNRRQAMRHTIL